MSEKLALLNAIEAAEAEGQDPSAAATAAMNAVNSIDDSGFDTVASLDADELADFLDADAPEPEYGREAIPDDAGENGMTLVDHE